MYVANSTQDLENITKSSNDISSYLFGATSFEKRISGYERRTHCGICWVQPKW